jgi:nicotinamidase-related amidase
MSSPLPTATLPAAACAALLAVTACAPPYTFGEPIDADLPERGALIVLDVQNDFMKKEGAFPVDTAQGDAALGTINMLLQAQLGELEADRPGMAVAYAKNDFDPADPANPFRGNSAIEGSDGAELDERLLRIDAPLFSKRESDAFSNDSFDAWLREQRVTHVYLTGVFSDGCVYATALAAQQRGYDVTIVADAVATADDDRLAASFDTFEREGFELRSGDEALAALLDD